MNLLFISQWCYPEPDARIFNMACELVKKGHSVQILTGFPNYPGGKIYDGYKLSLNNREVLSGVEIIRVWLYPSHDNNSIRRIFNYLSYAISASIQGAILTRKVDLIYVYHPPATVFIPAWILGKIYRAKIVYDIQDLWPDSISATNMLMSRKIFNLINYFQKWIYKRSSAIAVISEGFKKCLVNRGIPEEKVFVIKNWSIPIGEQELDDSEQFDFENKFVLMFAGNIGKAQGLKTVIDAAQILQKQNIEDILFVFVGTGTSKYEIMEYSESLYLKNVKFINRVVPEKIGSVLKKADVLLIHLINNPLFKITIPSKTQSYLMIGKPILAGIEGDAADIISSSGAGFIFTPEKPYDLVEKLLKMRSLSSFELNVMASAGKEYYNRNLAMEVGASKFEELFKKLLNKEKG